MGVVRGMQVVDFEKGLIGQACRFFKINPILRILKKQTPRGVCALPTTAPISGHINIKISECNVLFQFWVTKMPPTIPNFHFG